MLNLLITSCKYLDQHRVDKCNNFFEEFSDIWFLIYNSKLIVPIIIVFLYTIYLIFKIPSITSKKQNYYQIFSLSILFYLIIFNFRTNIPWVDDWVWIENLQTNELSLWEWLNQPTNIHNIFFTKLIFLFVDNYYNQNIEFFNILSVFIILLIGLMVLSKEDKINYLGLSLIIILIFSGKQFANFTQSCNIVWSLSFLYSILIYKYIDKQNLISKYINSVIIFIAPLTFGLGYIIPIYMLSFIYFHKINKKLKILYIFISLFSLTLAIFLPKLFSPDIEPTVMGYNYLNFDFVTNYKFYVTYFGVLSNVYLPWINGMAYIGFIIGIFQFLTVLFIFQKIYKSKSKEEYFEFLSQNILISFGLIFALLVSITRSDLQTVVAARYSVGSILFQIGFWKLIFENYKFKKNLYKICIFAIILYTFFLGIFSPYHGLHWQAKRYAENSKILNCYKTSDIKNCNKIAYKSLFYGANWYDFNTFEKQISELKLQKKSFFNF